ncbi:MAG TPA: hypothetical protein VJ885_09845, partial [Thermoanaerobaculia bacterium]|nr:hypothetical protein [Thermoanaerobaculia bacterium]
TGRVALVGNVTDEALQGLYTPTSSTLERMSELELHGQALDTLLGRGPVREAHPAVVLLLLLGLAAWSLAVHQRLEARLSLWLGVGLLVALVAAAALLFLSARVWLPLGTLILGQAALFVLFTRRKVLFAQGAARRLLLDSSARMRERLWPVSFYLGRQPWAQIATVAHQTLELRGSVFLEKVEGEHRVREIEALNGSLAEIGEQRRDYERPPYSLALAERGPVRVERFLARPEAEEQYLVPLAFAGEVIGFWALAVEPREAAAIQRFQELVRDFADQMAELLYHRQQVQRQTASPGLVRRVLTMESEAETFRALNRIFGLMERRLDRMESLMAATSTASAVYDVFGRLLEANAAMLDLLRDEGIVPYERTLLDVVGCLCGCDTPGARRYLRHVLVRRETIRLPARLGGRPGSSFALLLRPVGRRDSSALLDEPSLFNVIGVVVELADVSHLARLDEIRAQVSQGLGAQMRGDLGAVDLAASLLVVPQVSASRKDQALQILHAKVREMVQLLGDFQKYLGATTEDLAQEAYPVNPLPVLERAVEGLASDAAAREVAFEVVKPYVTNEVFASPLKLENGFRALLRLLLQDALRGSRLKVEVEEKEQFAAFRFADSGYGLPEESLRDLLFGNGDAPADVRTLRESLSCVRAWGGRVETWSRVGEGMRVSVELRTLR